MDNYFNILNKINVNEYVEKKKVNGKELSYLSWSNAIAEVKKIYPDMNYTIKKFDNNLPYVYDENTGYMVFTDITIEGQTHEMWLFVMDGANKAMKNKQYEYQVKEYIYGKPTGNMITKTVEPASMFDINTTIMRCLVKNLAMFGLGLYIYAGEDLPESEEVVKEKKEIEDIGIKKIDTLKHDAIKLYIKNNGFTNKEVETILLKFGYSNTSMILNKDIAEIRKLFLDLIKEKK